MRLSPSASFKTANAWAVAGAASLLFAIGLATAPIATAETCDNAALRAQNDSTALPDCRAYEMVSPPYKEGFPVGFPVAFTDDGIVSFGSLGSFAGHAAQTISIKQYHATRSAAGWVTSPMTASELTYDTLGATAMTESVDLRRSLSQMTRRDLPGDTRGFWLRGPDGDFTRIGDAFDDALKTRFFVTGSADLSHIVFNHGPQGGVLTALYEYVGTGNGPDARPVSVDNDGQPTQPDSCANRVSGDGRVIAFMSRCGFGMSQVWARVAGSATVAVSGSECTRGPGDPGGACKGVSAAQYAGMAADGSRAFFTTAGQLVNGDTDTGSDLYACDIPDGVPAPVGTANPCASLTEVSGTATNAKVEDVVAVSEDGSRVYFVAQGVLADNLGADGVEPATVADTPDPHNLYVWSRDDGNPAGQTRFVARLAASDLGRAQLTPDGRYLLFVTANQLVTAGLAADSDGVKDAYRYDAVTRSIVRVSTSVSGSGGNDPASDVSLAGGSSAMSADGSMVIFDSAEALLPDDINGLSDVYGWHDGQVSLISAGGASSEGISRSGRDIFFSTGAQVLAADGDFITDIYTARVGGGFDPSRPAPCAGDGCQGLLSGAPALAGPRSGLSGDSDPGDAVALLSLRAVSAAQRKTLAATGKVNLVVSATAAGTVTARATIAGRPVGSARQALTAPGRATVTLRLSKRARGLLVARGRLSVRVAVSHSKAASDRVVTLKLTRAKAKRSARHGSGRRVAGGRS